METSIQKNRVFIWGIVVFSFVVGLIHRLSMGALAESLVRELNYSGSMLGFLSSATLYAYAIMQIPAGFLVDWLGVRKVCGAGLVLTALGSILFASTSVLSIAIIGRILVGVGTSGMMLSAFKLQTELFEEKKFPALSGITSCCGNVGVLLAMSPFALLVNSMGWRESYYLVSAITLVLAVIVFIVVPKSDKVQLLSLKEAFNRIKTVIVNPKTWPPFGILFTMMGVMTIFNGLWGIPYIMHVYGVDNVVASRLLSMIPIGFIICGPLIGRVCDKLKGGVRQASILGSVLMASLMAVLVIFGAKPPIGVMPVIFVLMGIAGLTHILAFTKAKEVTALTLSGIVTAVVNMGEFIGSSILGPTFGFILDRGWQGQIVNDSRIYSAQSYTIVFAIATILCIGTVYCSIKLKKTTNN